MTTAATTTTASADGSGDVGSNDDNMEYGKGLWWWWWWYCSATGVCYLMMNVNCIAYAVSSGIDDNYVKGFQRRSCGHFKHYLLRKNKHLIWRYVCLWPNSST
jgi:hypothetical protein